MATMIGSIKEDIKSQMGNNVPSDVIDKTFDQLGELSDSLKSYFDQMLNRIEQIDGNILAIR